MLDIVNKLSFSHSSSSQIIINSNGNKIKNWAKVFQHFWSVALFIDDGKFLSHLLQVLLKISLKWYSTAEMFLKHKFNPVLLGAVPIGNESMRNCFWLVNGRPLIGWDLIDRFTDEIFGLRVPTSFTTYYHINYFNQWEGIKTRMSHLLTNQRMF